MVPIAASSSILSWLHWCNSELHEVGCQQPLEAPCGLESLWTHLQFLFFFSIISKSKEEELAVSQLWRIETWIPSCDALPCQASLRRGASQGQQPLEPLHAPWNIFGYINHFFFSFSLALKTKRMSWQWVSSEESNWEYYWAKHYLCIVPDKPLGGMPLISNSILHIQLVYGPKCHFCSLVIFKWHITMSLCGMGVVAMAWLVPKNEPSSLQQKLAGFLHCYCTKGAGRKDKICILKL